MVEKADSNLISSFFFELFTSPINVALLGLCSFLLYKIYKGRSVDSEKASPKIQLPPLKKQDMNLRQLRQYDGTGPDGRVLVAVNGKVFDVTRGRDFYGPGKSQRRTSLYCNQKYMNSCYQTNY